MVSYEKLSQSRSRKQIGPNSAEFCIHMHQQGNVSWFTGRRFPKRENIRSIIIVYDDKGIQHLYLLLDWCADMIFNIT
jgi:hypothetical protein